MWGEIIAGFKVLISLAQGARSDRKEREKIREQLDELIKVVQWLWDRETQRTRDEEHQRHDQANELLRLKIQLLEFERRPPAPGTPPPPLRLNKN